MTDQRTFEDLVAKATAALGRLDEAGKEFTAARVAYDKADQEFRSIKRELDQHVGRMIGIIDRTES